MSREKFDLGKAPQINIIRCGGNLTVRGSIDSQVVVDGRDPEIQQTDAGLTIASNNDLSLRLPEAASLVVEQVRGNLAVKGVAGDIQINQIEGNGAIKSVETVSIQQAKHDLALKNINGDLTIKHVEHDLAMRNVGQVNIGVVEGDVAARYVNGALSLASGQGDVSLRTINGNLTVQQIARDLNLRNLGGLVQVGSVAGDIRLYGGLISGDHRLTADGDIVVIWPDDAPLNLSATARSIRSRLELKNSKEMEGELHGRLGDGQTNLQLTAGHQIVLKPTANLEWNFAGDELEGFDLDMGNLAEEIGAQISSRMSALSSRLEQKFGEDWGHSFEERASRAAQKAEEAMRRAEKAMKQTRRAAAAPGVFMSAPAPSVKEQQATEAEQLKILRMVEQGIITPDEANTLLNALE